jgi:hypothetical protein
MNMDDRSRTLLKLETTDIFLFLSQEGTAWRARKTAPQEPGCVEYLTKLKEQMGS